MALKLKSRTEKFIPTWEGNDQLPPEEQIAVTFRRMTVGDYFKLQQDTGTNLMAGITVDPNDVESMGKHWRFIETVLVQQQAVFTGVEIDGKAITGAKEVADCLQVVHLPLLAEIANKILMLAAPSEDDVKNSGAGSEPPSLEPAPSVPLAPTT